MRKLVDPDRVAEIIEKIDASTSKVESLGFIRCPIDGCLGVYQGEMQFLKHLLYAHRRKEEHRLLALKILEKKRC